MLLSYLEAFRQKESGMISWEEYIHHLFARFTSFHNEHDDDDVEGLHKKLRDTDPFGYCIYCWSKDIDKVKGTSQSKGRVRIVESVALTISRQQSL